MFGLTESSLVKTAEGREEEQEELTWERQQNWGGEPLSWEQWAAVQRYEAGEHHHICVLDLQACRADGYEEAGLETRRWSMWGTVVLVRVLDWLHSGRRKLITSRVVWEGTSLVVQQLRLCALNAGGWGSSPGQGTRSPCCNSRPSTLQWRLKIL